MTRILLIDDDDEVRTMLARTLSHFGHTVIEAQNGAEGLDLFAKAGVDLVITDIVMPEREGLEVLMDLSKRQPPPVIIAISGGGRTSGPDYLAMAAKMGAQRVLTKPFSSDLLLATIDEVMGGSASADPEAKSQ